MPLNVANPHTAFVVNEYRSKAGAGSPLSLRNMARELSDVLKDYKMSVGRQAIANWSTGDAVPSLLTMQILAKGADGWIKNFAIDILHLINPQVYPEHTPVIDKIDTLI